MAFVFTTALLGLVTVFPHQTLDLFVQTTLDRNADDYFHALIDGRQNHSRISRNLQELPMVSSVELLSREDIALQVQNILGNLSTTLSEGLINLDYVGIKVNIDRTSSESSRQLVRDYLVRLVGEGQITLGHIVTPNTGHHEEKSKLTLSFLSYGPFVVALGLWLIALRPFLFSLKQQSYLIEQFQRRENVALKTYGIIAIIAVGTLVLASLSLSGLTVFVLISAIFFLSPLITFRQNYQWQ